MSTLLNVTVGGTPVSIDIAGILNVEAIDVQKVTGYAYREFLQKIDEGDITAITALVYIARKRHEPELKFRDVEFPIADWNTREWVGDEVDADAEDDEPDPTPVVGETTESN